MVGGLSLHVPNILCAWFIIFIRRHNEYVFTEITNNLMMYSMVISMKTTNLDVICLQESLKLFSLVPRNDSAVALVAGEHSKVPLVPSEHNAVALLASEHNAVAVLASEHNAKALLAGEHLT